MTGVLDREQLLALIPHAGDMCLLDRVVDFGADSIHCETASHRDATNPLRRADTLSAVHLVEYAAQAMAAHGALKSDGRAQPGMLAGLRDVRLHVRYIHDIPGNLTVRATRRVANRDGLLYEFSVSAADRPLCEGRIAIALAPA
jgi:predicted hotdog family 3-hydroxylacyl-ACP dehydratase